MPSARPAPVCNHVGQQSEFYHQSHLRRAIVVYEFDPRGGLDQRNGSAVV